MSSQFLLALPVTAAFAALAYRLGMASPRGALGGLLVGTLVYACLGPQGFALLVLFVVGGSALTRLGYDRKRRAGGAEARGGRRESCPTSDSAVSAKAAPTAATYAAENVSERPSA